jgi:hypothetical protein
MKNLNWLLTLLISTWLLSGCGTSADNSAKPTQAMADVIAAAAMKSTRLYVAKAYVTFGTFSVVATNNAFGEVICGVTPTFATGCTGGFTDVINNPQLGTTYSRTLTYNSYSRDVESVEGLSFQLLVNGKSQYTVSAYASDKNNTRQYAINLTFARDLASVGTLSGTATCVDESIFVDTSCTFEFPGFQLIDNVFFGGRFTVNADLQGIAGKTKLTFSNNWDWNAGKTIGKNSTINVTTASGMTAVVKGSDTSVVTVDITVGGATTTFSSTLL